LTSVWVAGFGLERVGAGVVEGEVHGSTIATIVGGGAVNELLLRENWERSFAHVVSSFKSTSGGECPA
jgi:hypothetical protein